MSLDYDLCTTGKTVVLAGQEDIEMNCKKERISYLPPIDKKLEKQKKINESPVGCPKYLPDGTLNESECHCFD